MENHGADNCEITLLPIYVIERLQYCVIALLHYAVVALLRSYIVT